MSLPPAIASSVLQQHINAVLQSNSIQTIAMQKQLDGTTDTTDEEGSDVSDDNLDNDDEDDIEKGRWQNGGAINCESSVKSAFQSNI